MSLRITPLFGLVLVTASCSADPPQPSTSTVRDSAGVRIIDNALADDLPTWHTSSAPSVRIGGIEGDLATIFARVSGGVRLTDGRLIIADGQSRELRFFDPSGVHLRTVGGPGDGPGEFRSLWHLTRIVGDTLIASDWPIGKWNWFLANGDFVRRTQVGLYFPGLAGPPLRDGSLLADAWEHGSHGNETEFWAARGSEPEFRAQGYLVRIPRGEEAPVTGDDRTDTREAVISSLRQATRRADFERWLAAVPYPETKPTLDQLVVDTEGRLWAQVIGLNAENGWLIFDVEGALIARASIPAALRVLHIGPDHILGVRQDELEVEYVELYGIIR